jgi:hypothetical protein
MRWLEVAAMMISFVRSLLLFGGLMVYLASGGTAAELPPGQLAREAVQVQWKLPRLKTDGTATVKAQLLSDGHLIDPQFTLGGPLATEGGQAAELTRRSLEEAIRRAVVATASRGPVEFTLQIRSGGRVPGCFPLRVALPVVLKDTQEPIPEVLFKGLEQGLIKWNAMVVGYAEGKLPEPLVVVPSPEQADVVVEAFEDYPDYSSYFIDERSGRVVVRMPFKRDVGALLMPGFRWWHPEQITQQTMFQLGRQLGLGLSEINTNVLYPEQSLTFVTSPQKGLGVGTRNVQTEVIGNLVNEYGGGDRTVTSFQLEDAGDFVRTRRCAAERAPTSPNVINRPETP